MKIIVDANNKKTELAVAAYLHFLLQQNVSTRTKLASNVEEDYNKKVIIGLDEIRNNDIVIQTKTSDKKWTDYLVMDDESEETPLIKGTYISVRQIISHIVDGWSLKDIFRYYPEVTPEDIQACIHYAKEVWDLSAPYPTLLVG